MPSIRDAMVASLSHSLVRRDIGTTVSEAKTTFTTWDGCMAKTYCKWPVIAAIIIASLILLSIISCIIRCACCGVSCCCSCFSCLKCCGNCCGCCDDPKGKKHKHLDDEYGPKGPSPFHGGYHAQAPMMAGGVEPPKYAQFEVGPTGHAVAPKAVNDDALPPMPSWDTASKKRVMNEEEKGVELGELDPATGQKMPLMSGAVPISRSGSPGAISPAPSPYGDAVQPHDYMGAGAAGMGGAVAGGAMAGGAMAAGGMGRGGQDPYSRGPGYRGPPNPSLSPYGQPISPVSAARSPGQNQYDQYFDSAQPQGFGGAAGAYGRPGPGGRQYSNNSAASGRPFPPNGPQRQYSQDAPSYRTNAPSQQGGPRSPYNQYSQPQRGIDSGMAINMPSADDHRVASPPLQNNSGFNFSDNNSVTPPNQGYRHPSPPQELPSGGGMGGAVMGGGAYRRPSPPQQQHSQSSYAHSREQSQAYEMDSGYEANHQQQPQQRHQQQQGGGGYPGYKPYQSQQHEQRW